VQATGFALFNATFYQTRNPSRVKHNISTGETQEFWKRFPLFRDEENIILSNVAFFSIYSQTEEEYYQLWAMVGAIIAVMYPVFTSILNFVYQHILPLLP